MHTQLTEVLLILWLNHPPEFNIWTPLEPRDQQEESWSYNTFRNWYESHSNAILHYYKNTMILFLKSPRTCKRKRESSGGRNEERRRRRSRGEEELAEARRREKESKDRQKYLLLLDSAPPLKLVCSTWQLLSCLKITYLLLHAMFTFQTTFQHISLTEGRSGNESLNCYSPLSRHTLGTCTNFEKHVIYLLDWSNFSKCLQNHQVNMYLEGKHTNLEHMDHIPRTACSSMDSPFPLMYHCISRTIFLDVKHIYFGGRSWTGEMT